MVELWRIHVIRMHKQLISAHTVMELFRNDFIIKSGDARIALINNNSKTIVTRVKKFIDTFLCDLENFEKTIKNNLKVSGILQYICSSKNKITNDMHNQVTYFLSIFDAGIPQPWDVDQTIQAFQDFFDCYTTAIENILAFE